MSVDVLAEDERGFDFSNESGKFRPEVARITRSETLPCCAEWLARVAARYEIHNATPWPAIEGLEIVPDRRPIQGLVFHPRHESGRCEGFPLNVSHGSVGVPEGKLESKFKSSSPGA